MAGIYAPGKMCMVRQRMQCRKKNHLRDAAIKAYVLTKTRGGRLE